MKPLLPILALLLPAAALAIGFRPGGEYTTLPCDHSDTCRRILPAAPQGFYERHQDWETACDNTGTCRIAGYQANETAPPASLLFTRPAGADAPVSGQLALGLKYGQADIPAGSRAEIRLNGQSIGSAPLDKSLYATLDKAQTQALIATLKTDARIEIAVGQQKWTVSDKGAAAALTRADGFQQRTDTPSALIRQGSSSHSVMPPYDAPAVRAVPVPQTGTYTLKKSTARYRQVLALLQQTDNAPDRCPNLHQSKQPHDIRVYPLNDRQALIAAACLEGAYQSTGFNAVPDKNLSRVQQILPRDYGGFGGFDPKTATLSGSFKGRGLGDCLHSQSAVWNGLNFSPARKSSTGQCKGFPGGAWELPEFVSKNVGGK